MSKDKPRLRFNKETLKNLTTQDLRKVAGGMPGNTCLYTGQSGRDCVISCIPELTCATV